MKKLLCRLFGHRLMIQLQRDERTWLTGRPSYTMMRLLCTRCGARDPYHQG